MKEAILSTLAVLLMSTSSYGLTKICFAAGPFQYSGANINKGDYFFATFKSTSMNVKNIKGEGSWPGDYKFDSETQVVQGRDGEKYLGLYTRGDDGCTRVLVNVKLRKPGTVGMIKFRCRGEGFNETRYMCRDKN